MDFFQVDSSSKTKICKMFRKKSLYSDLNNSQCSHKEKMFRCRNCCFKESFRHLRLYASDRSYTKGKRSC